MKWSVKSGGSVVLPTAVAAALAILFCQSAMAEPSLPRISFWLPKAMVLHHDSEAAVAADEKMLKQLGCKTTRRAHNGHTDLVYECPTWQSVALKSKSESQKWIEWLTKKGFSVVDNSPDESHAEVVQYRLPAEQRYHFDKPDAAQAHLALMKMLGCSAAAVKHSGHDDVIVTCPAWQSIGLANHELAHQWQEALQKMGFTTMHEH